MDAAPPNSRFPEFNLDPALAETVETAPPEQMVEGILRLENPDEIPPHFRVVSQFNRICTGRFLAAHTLTIRRHHNVISFKAARALGVPYDGKDLDEPVPTSGTAIAPRSPATFGGRRCIVAALDFGLDFAHPNFLNPDGTTRLVSFWHQGATYEAAHPNRYGYGRMFSPEEINAALRESDPYLALGYHPAISDTGSGSHGTHTLDIAAGNGRVGEAGGGSEADLMFVHLSTPLLGSVGDLGDSVRMLEALDHVERTAGGRPWVVNLSVGRTAGSHDGTSLVEQGMHELLRRGPDRAISQSGGNYRSADLAVEGWLRDGEHRDLEWIVDPEDTTDNEVDVWYSGKDRFVIAIRPPQGSAFVEIKLGDVADIIYEGAVVGRLYHRRNDPNNRDNHGEVFLYPGAPPGVWTLRLIGEYVISGRFHAWIERDLARPGAQSRFDAKITSQSYTLGTIATSPLVITVGAYDANAEGTPLAPFSSCGPTRDERRDKPELLAPGVGVVAARSIPRGALRQEGLLVARSGTSMAAPHVTGAIAAMFEAAGRPVSIDEIRDCLKRSAEPLTDSEQADCYAWGRLNIAGAIREIRGLKAADLVSPSQEDIFAPDPAMMFDITLDAADAAEESFVGTSEIEALVEGEDYINLDGISRALEQAEEAVNNVAGGRRQSETSFLQELLRELDDRISVLGPSPAELFRAVLYNGPLMQNARKILEVLAMPSQRPESDLRPGDWLLRAVPGTGDVGHISVLASGELLTQAMVASEGIPAEGMQPGYYGLVIEAGAFPHSRARPFARLMLDSLGRVPPNTVVLRPRYSDLGVMTDFPPYELDAEPAAPALGADVARDALLDFEWQTEALATEDQGTTQGLSVLVVDERGQPLVEGEYAIYQGGRSERGEFAMGGNGLALFKTIDTAQPFMFEVRDRVCAITAGAFIDPDDPAIEYGGTWFDWTLVRDNKNPDTAFWPHYLAEMKADANRKSVDRFWQHEHIVRRPIRAIGAAGGVSKPVKICAVPPQIRTGPIVRYTDHRCASIWIEPATPSLVKVRAKRAGGREAEKIAYASTVRVGGRHFAVVEVAGLDEDTFYQYTLELAPLPANGAIPVDPKDVSDAFPKIRTDVGRAMRQQLKDASVENVEWLSFRTLRSRYDKSLRFATGSCRWYPGDVIGGEEAGPDMLDKLGEWLCKTPRSQWPHFQFYSGDQIYADEIGDRHHVELIRARFASRVPGPKDPNASVADRLIDGAWAGRFAHRLEPLKPPLPTVRNNVEAGIKKIDSIYAQAPALRLFANRRVTDKQLNERYQTLLTKRRDVQRASREDDDEREARIAVNLLPQLKQLLVTAEPFRVYRPYWDAVPGSAAFNRQAYRYRSCNFLLWDLPISEADLPTLQDQTAGDVGVRGAEGRGHPSADHGKHVADFAEYAFLYERAWMTSRNVRVLLGNVPTFLMFDDHELTDDWNFDVAWVRMLHSTRDHYRMWPKTLTDALCAYWMYQGLGNKARSQWRDDHRAKILDQAQRAGIDALPELRKCIYRAVLAASPTSAEAPFQTGLSLDWHYKLPFEPPFLVPDCRSRKRLVPTDDPMRVIDHKRNPPQSETIDQEQIKWMRSVLDGCKHPIAFIAPSTPLLLQNKLMVFMTQPEVAARAWAGEVDVASALAVFLGSTALAIASADLIRLFRRAKDLEHMIRDKSWRDLWDIVERLRRNRSPVKTLALVSGDVHHSYCMTANLSGDGRPFPELLQITSSGLRTTIRGGAKESAAAWQSSLSFDMAEHHMVPGFLSKAGSRRREVALYKNAVAVVDVSLGTDVEVRVIHLAGDDKTDGVDKYVYQYTSGSSYIKMGEPTNTPYRIGESAEVLEGPYGNVAELIESGDSSLEPGQSITVDGQNVRTYVDAVAWYTARRDVLLDQRRVFVSEREKVPDGLDDLTRAADARIKAARSLGTQPLSDSDVEAMLEWLDRYIKVLYACDSKMEEVVAGRFRATQAQNEKFKEEVNRLQPRLRDLQRSAFRAGDRSKLKESAEVFTTVLDSVLVADKWVRDAATTMQDIKVLGTTLRTQKALHGSSRPWHELMRQSTNARVAKLLSVANGLNKVLAAWQLVDAGITVLSGGKTASAQASAGISLAATVASAGGTLLGASGFFTLYNNLYVGPMVKHILGQIEQLKDKISTGRNHPYIQLGRLDQVNWDIEPGGRQMYEFMYGVMKASAVTDVKAIPDSVSKYFSKYRKDFDAGTPKRHGVDINYADFDDKRVWVYSFRDDIWGMLYGSMPVPASMKG